MVARLCAHVSGVDKEALTLALGTAPKQTLVLKRNAFRYECAQCKKTNTAAGMSLSKVSVADVTGLSFRCSWMENG